jgi:hypothetical protein
MSMLQRTDHLLIALTQACAAWRSERSSYECGCSIYQWKHRSFTYHRR